MSVPTKLQLTEWVKEYYSHDWGFIMEYLTGQDRRIEAGEDDVDRALAKKFQTKQELIDYIFDLSEEGQKYLEDAGLVTID